MGISKLFITSVSFGPKKGNPLRNAETLKKIVCQTVPLAKLPPGWFLFVHEYDVFRQNADFKKGMECIIFKVATTVEQVDSQSNCLIEKLRILLRTRCNEYDINGFIHEEITKLIREIAYH